MELSCSTYGFRDKLMRTDGSLALWSAGLGSGVSIGVSRRFKNVLRPERFRVLLDGS